MMVSSFIENNSDPGLVVTRGRSKERNGGNKNEDTFEIEV